MVQRICWLPARITKETSSCQANPSGRRLLVQPLRPNPRHLKILPALTPCSRESFAIFAMGCPSITHKLHSSDKYLSLRFQTPDPGGRHQSGCKAASNPTPPVPSTGASVPAPAPSSTVPPAFAKHVTREQHSNSHTGEPSKPEADKADDTFTYHGSDSDPDLLSALSTQAARKAADHAPTLLLNAPQAKTITRVARSEIKWAVSSRTLQQLNLADDSTNYSNRAFVSSSPSQCQPVYPRTVCPNSGATSIMAPYRDMFLDYVDVRGEGLVVRLGDENQTIPIAGRGTLKINIQGHTMAYANALHVPQISMILFSSRVHQQISPGCSFIADNSSCYLTYSNFVIPIDDTDDCTIKCARVGPNTVFEFDSRLFLMGHSTQHGLRRTVALQLQTLHKARLGTLQKLQAHLSLPSDIESSEEVTSASKEAPPTLTLPTRPVYSVPDS
jgi:hypothetical protein